VGDSEIHEVSALKRKRGADIGMVRVWSQEQQKYTMQEMVRLCRMSRAVIEGLS